MLHIFEVQPGEPGNTKMSSGVCNYLECEVATENHGVAHLMWCNERRNIRNPHKER